MKNIILILVAAFALTSCKSTDANKEAQISIDATSDEVKSGVNLNISGSIQKGPYQIGTLVDVQGLDASMNTVTGEIAKTSISDDFGGFSSAVTLPNSTYGEISACGFFLNELTGSFTTDKFCSTAFLEPSTGPYNLNLATSLIKNRVKILIKGGMGGQAAFDSASYSLSKGLLGIGPSNLTSANNWKITDDSPLLAISAIALQQNQTIQTLEGWVGAIAADLEDGIISDANKLAFKESAIDLDIDKVETNVDNFYTSKGSLDKAKSLLPWLIILDPSKSISVVHSQGSGSQSYSGLIGGGATHLAIPFTVDRTLNVKYASAICPYDKIYIYSESGGNKPDTLIATGTLSQSLPSREYKDAVGVMHYINSDQFSFDSVITLQPGNYWSVTSKDGNCGYAGYEQVTHSQIMYSGDNMATWTNLASVTATSRLIFLN